MNIKTVKNFFHQVAQESQNDNIVGESAGLAFYMIFALIPMLIITFSVFGFFTSEASLRSGIIHYFGEKIGPAGAHFFTNIVSGISNIEINTIASLVGLVIVIFAATNLFRHAQKTFAKIFQHTDVSGESIITHVVNTRAVAFAYMIILLSLIFLIVVSNISITFFIGSLSAYFHSPSFIYFFEIIRHTATFLITIIVFSAIYHITSVSKLSWKSSLLGGFMASVLFTLVNIFLSTYLSMSDGFSAYGTAGFLIAFLLWFYFVGIALFFGAEVAKVKHK